MRCQLLIFCAVLFSFSLFPLSSCRNSGGSATSNETPAPSAKTNLFRGYYTWAFEISRFTPCGSSEEWWLSGDLSGLPDNRVPGAPLYIEVRGDLSPEGQYGHLGAYKRQLEVREITRTNFGGNCQ
jgi:hypothetical protein